MWQESLKKYSDLSDEDLLTHFAALENEQLEKQNASPIGSRKKIIRQ